MPALERLAMPGARTLYSKVQAVFLCACTASVLLCCSEVECTVHELSGHTGACFLLQMTAERLLPHRAQGAPPLQIVRTIERSNLWGGVQVDIPFEPANEFGGVELSCVAFKRLMSMGT